MFVAIGAQAIAIRQEHSEPQHLIDGRTKMESQAPLLRDGFRVLKTVFDIPKDIGELDKQAKRRATICNLFVNHMLAISEIVRVLDESHGHTIRVLIEQRVIQERRLRSRVNDDSSSRPGFRARMKGSSGG